MADCIHSAIAPNMDRCINCGAWVGLGPEPTASGGDSASPEWRAREFIASRTPSPEHRQDVLDGDYDSTEWFQHVKAALANQQGVEFPDVSDAEISAWLDRHDLSHAIRGADARAAFEDAQSFVLTMQPTQPAGDVGSGNG